MTLRLTYESHDTSGNHTGVLIAADSGGIIMQTPYGEVRCFLWTLPNLRVYVQGTPADQEHPWP